MEVTLLLYGLSDCSLSRLQRILNTAARILCKIPKFDHITKTLLDLHWLPIQQRILFKILILILILILYGKPSGS